MTVADISKALTQRESEITALVSSGLANKEIARMLGLTEGSVKQYLHTAFRKLGIQRREHLILHRLSSI
jgi:two-component system nitrate/nitrite response regulator NarL